MFSFLKSNICYNPLFPQVSDYYVLGTEQVGVVGSVNKPGMAELSVLTTHCLTYSIISSWRTQVNLGLSASSVYPTEFSAPLTLLNVKSPSTDLAFNMLPLATWTEGTDQLSMAACGIKVT